MAILLRHKSSIFGLEDDLAQLATDIGNEAIAREASDGDLSTLTTTAKDSLVSAINEVMGSASTGSSNALQIASNLSDVADVEAARTNLDVMSTTEINSAINVAQLAMGTNHNAADITERDAMVDLGTTDRVFVLDDGDGKWAFYKVHAVDETGAGTDWVKLADQDSLENSINAASVKATYELNEDTNAFTDADAAKVGFLSVTSAIDLDDAVLAANLVQDLLVSTATDEAPSVAAVKAYADEAARLGGSQTALETVVVSGSEITLTNAPKDGLSSIVNFGTVRHIDVNGVAYDAPLVATATANVFTVSTDTANQWDTFSVQVQYTFVA